MKSSWIRFFLYFIVMIGLTGCDKKEEFLKGKTEATDTVEYEKEINPAEEVMKEADPMEPYYGAYKVIDFYPSDAWVGGYREGMPWEEAEMMIGKEIVITEEKYQGYDNDRTPNSEIRKRGLTDYRLEKVSIEEPMCQVNSVRREEVYGLRDNMLPDELVQEEYVEVKTTKYYEIYYEKYMKFYLLDNRQVLMLCMNEYFLMEKADERQTVTQKEEGTEAEIETRTIENIGKIQDQEELMEPYYGYYEISMGLGWDKINKRIFEKIPLQEVDLLTGKIITIQKELFETYNNDRKEGSIRMMRNEYEIYKDTVINPVYEVKDRKSEDLFEIFAGKDLGISTCIGDTIFQNITKVIRIPNSKNTQSLYALEGSDEMILYLTDADMCFLLKKIEKKPEIKIADLLKKEEEVQILEEFYGNYRVTGFLPTLYFPSMDVLVFKDCAKLPGTVFLCGGKMGE